MTAIEFSKVLLMGFGGLAALAYYITHLAETGITGEAKSKLSNIVKNFKATPTIRHSFITFTLLSDHFFGDKLLSLRAVFLSSLLSILWMSLVTVVCLIMFPNYSSWIGDANLMTVIFRNAIPVLMAVLLIDYISLTVTRLLVRSLKVRTILGLLSILIFDFFVAVILFYIGLTTFKFYYINPDWLSFGDSVFYWMKVNSMHTALQTLNDLTSDMLVRNSDGSYDIKGGWNTEIAYAFPEGIAFYSSLLTSIWLWLHIISYSVLKVATQTDALKNKLMKFVNINEKPFSALALIILFLYIPISIILVFVHLIIQYLT